MGNANLLDAQVVMVPATGVDVTQCCGPKTIAKMPLNPLPIPAGTNVLISSTGFQCQVTQQAMSRIQSYAAKNPRDSFYVPVMYKENLGGCPSCFFTWYTAAQVTDIPLTIARVPAVVVPCSPNQSGCCKKKKKKKKKGCCVCCQTKTVNVYEGLPAAADEFFFARDNQKMGCCQRQPGKPLCAGKLCKPLCAACCTPTLHVQPAEITVIGFAVNFHQEAMVFVNAAGVQGKPIFSKGKDGSAAPSAVVMQQSPMQRTETDDSQVSTT